MQEKAGVIAGAIWNVLDQVESMSAKDLKKAVYGYYPLSFPYCCIPMRLLGRRHSAYL